VAECVEWQHAYSLKLAQLSTAESLRILQQDAANKCESPQTRMIRRGNLLERGCAWREHRINMLTAILEHCLDDIKSTPTAHTGSVVKLMRFLDDVIAHDGYLNMHLPM